MIFLRNVQDLFSDLITYLLVHIKSVKLINLALFQININQSQKVINY